MFCRCLQVFAGHHLVRIDVCAVRCAHVTACWPLAGGICAVRAAGLPPATQRHVMSRDALSTRDSQGALRRCLRSGADADKPYALSTLRSSACGNLNTTSRCPCRGPLFQHTTLQVQVPEKGPWLRDHFLCGEAWRKCRRSVLR